MCTHKIAVIPGDGIGREVVAAGIEVLAACAAHDGGFALETTSFDWGSDRYKTTGAMMPADGIEALRPSTRSCSAPSTLRMSPIVCCGEERTHAWGRAPIP